MSEMRWFRMWTDAVDNPKLRLLAFEDRWHFVALCCLKRSGLLDRADDGTRDRMIAVKLGVQCRELDEIRRRLVEVGLVDSEMQPVGWDDRQYVSDNSTERVRRHRMKQQCNVSETPPDTETDTDKSLPKKEDTAPAKSARVPSKHINAVFRHWQETHGHHGAKPTEKRRRLIAQRLKDYTVEELRQCISGYRLSPWHRGDNPQATKYDSIELMLRDAEHVERGIEFSRNPPAPRGTNGKDQGDAAHKPQSARERAKQKLRERAERLAGGGRA